MRRYDDGAFVSREPGRRPLRDDARDRFFAELGVDRLKDPFAYDPDPAGQLGVVLGLIDKARSLHQDETWAIDKSLALIAAAALGVPLAGIGSGAAGRPSLSAMTILRMNQDSFPRWLGSEGFDQDQAE